MEWKLAILEGPECSFLLENKWQLPASIGRSPNENTIILDHEKISRKHCKIQLLNNSLTLIDLNSKGGTWHNTIRIEPEDPIILSKDDLLEIGPWIFRVELKAEHKKIKNINDTRATRATMFQRLRANETISRDEAWHSFHKKYQPIIAGFARNANLPTSDIDDLIQEIFSKFIQIVNDFEYDPSKGRFRGFLKTMTVNAVRSKQRKKKEQEMPELAEPASSAEVSLESSFEKEWAHGILRRAFVEVRNQFEEKTWNAFELTGLRGIASNIAAKELGVSHESVRSAKSRITKKLAETVARLREEEENGGE